MEEFLDFATRNWMLFALLVAVLAMMIVNEVLRMRRGGQALSALETLRLFNDEDAVLVDVREIAEYREGHIPEATNIPLATLKQGSADLEKYKPRPIVVYCRTGNRAPGIIGQLKKQGFERIYNLTGGLESWKSASLPVMKGRK